jgi:membrane associated rhomboid family serine protease
MPREGAQGLAQFAVGLQWDRGRWLWLLIIVLILDLVLGLGDSVGDVLRYDRSAIAAGGWWRLLTAHIVHLDFHHLLLNELGLVLMWALFAEDYDAVEWCAIVCAGALAISSGLFWLSPHAAPSTSPRSPGIGGFSRSPCAPSSLTSNSAGASRPSSWWMPICTARCADLRSVPRCPGGPL